MSLDPDLTSAPVPSVSELEGAVALDFDANSSYIYFSQVAAKKISRVKIGTNKVEDLIINNSSEYNFDNYLQNWHMKNIYSLIFVFDWMM